jgi:hypothetical protein
VALAHAAVADQDDAAGTTVKQSLSAGHDSRSADQRKPWLHQRPGELEQWLLIRIDRPLGQHRDEIYLRGPAISTNEKAPDPFAPFDGLGLLDYVEVCRALVRTAGDSSRHIEAVLSARDLTRRDFLLALALALGLVALALLAAATLAGGILQDLLVNLGAGVVGTLLTVVLIDGLWKRQEAGASATFDAIGDELEERRASSLSVEERRAWRSFVDEYRSLVRAESPLDRIRALPSYRRRLLALEQRGKRTLKETRPGPTRRA